MRKFLAGLGILSLVLALAAPVWAAEDVVVATVTPQVVAVTVEDGVVDYGILDFSESSHTNTAASPAGTALETQTIDRSISNVDIDITLSSSDATGDSGTWNLVSATPVADEFRHEYDINATATPVWADFPANHSYAATVTLTESDTSATLDLQFAMPLSSTDTSVHSVTVTVLATES